MRIGFVAGQHQLDLLAFRKGEVDLCFVRGKWLLACTCDIPETEEFKACRLDWRRSGHRLHRRQQRWQDLYRRSVERVRANYVKRRKGLQSAGRRPPSVVSSNSPANKRGSRNTQTTEYRRLS